MPPQKIWKPPPVPVDSTIGADAPVWLANSSATAWVYGNTVEEPTMRIWSRAAAAVAEMAAIAATDAVSFRDVMGGSCRLSRADRAGRAPL